MPKLKELILLFIASILWMLFIGKWSIGIASWLCLIIWLRCSIKMKLWQFFAFGYPMFAIMAFISAFGIIRSTKLSILVVLGVTFFYFLPFLINKLFFNRQQNSIWTLFFPAIFTLFDFLVYKLNPFGSWTSPAYSQYDNLPLLQIISLLGIWGVTFLIAWGASIFNFLWLKNFEFTKISKSWLVYPVFLILVILIGAIRLEMKVNTDFVRVASIGVDDSVYDPKLVQKLFELTEKESRAGAKIILWAEGNGRILDNQEVEMMQKAAEIAKQEKIYLFSSWWITQTNLNPKLAKNKVVGFDPKGQKILDYLKTYPVPGEPIIKGDGKLQTADTEFGRIGVAICFDNDFPDFIAQAGKNNVDIFLSPSRDWQAIDPKHTKNLTFRAIENGMSLVKHTNLGYSISVDNLGRTLAKMDFFNTKERVMISQVPVKKQFSIYPHFPHIILIFSAMIVLLLPTVNFIKKQIETK